MPGAKNSVLKLMATTLLTDGTFHLTNVPDIADVTIMGDLLAAIGVDMVGRHPAGSTLTNTGNIVPVAPYELVERIRASINVLGPLLTRCGHVRLSLPGGDDFGSRPIDMHIAGLEAMGATFKFSHGYLEAFADRLHGADITFDFPSVGRDREPADGGGARRRERPASTTPPVSPRSPTCATSSSRWAPTSRASARRRS